MTCRNLPFPCLLSRNSYSLLIVVVVALTFPLDSLVSYCNHRRRRQVLICLIEQSTSTTTWLKIISIRRVYSIRQTTTFVKSKLSWTATWTKSILVIFALNSNGISTSHRTIPHSILNLTSRLLIRQLLAFRVHDSSHHRRRHCRCSWRLGAIGLQLVTADFDRMLVKDDCVRWRTLQLADDFFLSTIASMWLMRAVVVAPGAAEDVWWQDVDERKAFGSRLCSTRE